MSMKDVIKELINKMGFDCEVEERGLFINIKANEPCLLIGQNGENIYALQHLVKLIIIKNLPAGRQGSKAVPKFTLDINHYRQQKINSLKQIAKESACRACVLKKEIALKPMSAYERRLIHLELADRKDVITESRGDEPNRQIVIRPV